MCTLRFGGVSQSCPLISLFPLGFHSLHHAISKIVPYKTPSFHANGSFKGPQVHAMQSHDPISLFVRPNHTTSRIPHTRPRVLRRYRRRRVLPTALWSTGRPMPTLASIPRSSGIIPPSAVRGRSADPSLLHRRAAGADPFGSSAASDAAAQDRQEEEAADATADANDDVSVTLDPRADFFGSRGTSALAL